MDNILIIDDEEGIRFSLQKVLTHFGYKVTVARNGQEGIEMFDKEKDFDLVITGICMPKKDGNEVARYIRRSKKAKTPMVAMTGSTDYKISRDLFNCLLTKPFKMDSLMHAIQSSKEDTDSLSPTSPAQK